WLILRMLLIQIIVNVILSLPVTIYLFYAGLTQYYKKSMFRIFMENYVYNMFTLLQYINAATLTNQTNPVEFTNKIYTKIEEIIGINPNQI
ncbi:unnamed protein product, partial [Adineta steineri]